ncbi:unnamed protein product [Arctia plantaginis]|uniref:Peptidase S1 domain-containing protein n=1 Tax=Arctia plantaginis TaxID=874455 RepID=A0A8S1BGK9_ARCPL|nr:unnamed protein product [Arctia plantaginis]
MLYHSVFLISLTFVSCQYINLDEGSQCSWRGVQGSCVKAHRCLSAVKDIESKLLPPVCSFDGNTPIICCTDCQLVPDTRLLLFNPHLGILTKSGTSKAKDKCLEFVHQLDYPCKKYRQIKKYAKNLDPVKGCTNFEEIKPKYPSGGGASGGVDAKRGQYPHMALLGYGDSVQTADWVCGGTVISERFILTAGHCLFSSRLGPVKYIALGILKRSDPEELWQGYNVQTIFRHPEYKPPSKYHDIALLETDRIITFNSEVRPACLHVDDKPDSYAFATGWGALGHKQGLADVLQSVMLSRFEKEECSTHYPPHRLLVKGFDNLTQMCYGDRMDKSIPTDTCEGDSGGPLQSLQHEDCVFTILGVTSYGRQCGLSGGTGMYTRVRSYVSWIEDIVWP